MASELIPLRFGFDEEDLGELTAASFIDSELGTQPPNTPTKGTSVVGVVLC